MCMKNLVYTAFHGRLMNISPDMRCRFVLPMWMESIIAQKVVSWCEIHFNHWQTAGKTDENQPGSHPAREKA